MEHSVSLKLPTDERIKITVNENEMKRNPDDRKEKTEDTESKEELKISQLQKDGDEKQSKHISCTSNDEYTPDSSNSNQTSSEVMNEINLPKVKEMENTKEDIVKYEKVPTLEFDWMSFFEKQNKDSKGNQKNVNETISPVPNHVFAHVEASLDGGVREGMIVEMPYEEKNSSRKKETNQQFWLAKVDAVYGPLLKLSYVGRNEPKKVIWHDLEQKRLFPLGS